MKHPFAAALGSCDNSLSATELGMLPAILYSYPNKQAILYEVR